MIIFARHGRTKANELGHETLRGWLPLPLSLEGMQEAEDLAHTLSDVEDVEAIHCGTLVRVIQTAQEVGEALGMMITPAEELNDWNTGDFAGKPVKATLDLLHDHIRHPLKKVAGGEPFQFFVDRITPHLTKLIESDKLYIVISSGRIGTLLKALSVNGGDHPSTEILLGKPPIDPAGIMILNQEWKIVWKTAKDEESKGLS